MKEKKQYMYKIRDVKNKSFLSPTSRTKVTWRQPAAVVSWLKQYRKNQPKKELEVWSYPIETGAIVTSSKEFIDSYDQDHKPRKDREIAKKKLQEFEKSICKNLSELLPLGYDLDNYRKAYYEMKLSAAMSEQFATELDKVEAYKRKLKLYEYLK